jgi:hypothetical protein
MTKEKKQKKPKKKDKAAKTAPTDEQTADIEKTVDPYTGELKPVAEDADQFVEVIPEETDNRNGKNYLLNEETSMDVLAADEDADAVAEQSAHYTEDKDIEDDFAERQRLAIGGRDVLREELEEHNSLSPEISGGDLDAAWQSGNVAGEETVGGTAPTPDQDIVDELGEAAGLTYKDNELLNSDAKILDRDRNRWELNPASADDQEELEAEEDIEDEENEEEELDKEDELGEDEYEDIDEEDELEEEDEDLEELGYEIEGDDHIDAAIEEDKDV